MKTASAWDTRFWPRKQEWPTKNVGHSQCLAANRLEAGSLSEKRQNSNWPLNFISRASMMFNGACQVGP